LHRHTDAADECLRSLSSHVVMWSCGHVVMWSCGRVVGLSGGQWAVVVIVIFLVPVDSQSRQFAVGGRWYAVGSRYIAVIHLVSVDGFTCHNVTHTLAVGSAECGTWTAVEVVRRGACLQ